MPDFDRAYWLARLDVLSARVRSRARWARAAHDAGRADLCDALCSDLWDIADEIAEIRDNADDVIPEARRAYRNAQALRSRLADRVRHPAT